MAHTPGPWYAYKSGHMKRWDITTEPDPNQGAFYVAQVPSWNERSDPAANARLIAAAPDMLAALELYVALDNDHRSGCTIEPDDWAECHQAAAAAIAKAKGEDA